jgi:uncharacterized protein HemX
MAFKNKLGQAGFGAVEGLMILVIIALIGGVGFYVYKQKSNADSKLSSSVTSTPETKSKVTANGTPESVDQMNQQEADTEKSINDKYQNSDKQSVNSANSAVSGVGDSYNESNL